MNQRNGMETAIHTAMTAKRLAAIARAAAVSGAKGAALQAAKEYAPALTKALFALLVILILIPFLIVSALPNIYFSFDSNTSGDIAAMNAQAKAVTQYYREFLDFDESEVEKMVAELSAGYDDVQVEKNMGKQSQYWLIAICSVAYQQDLFSMDRESMRERFFRRFFFHASEEAYTEGEGDAAKTLKRLKINIGELEPDALMEELGFTEEQKNWAKTIYATIADDQTIRPGAPGYLPGDSLNDYGDVHYKQGDTEVVYYNQGDARWGNKLYGKYDTIRVAGCGPTSLAMVVSTFTDRQIDPGQMADWAYRNGYRCEGSGSYHSLIPEGARHFGLKVEGATVYEGQKIVDALADGKLVVAIMGPGHFTTSGHFIVLRGVTEDGKILIADPASVKKSGQEGGWDLSIFLNEARRGAAAGGPFWIISKP